MDWNTASASTSQNMEIFSRISLLISFSLRQTRISGVMPMLRSSFTLCWVGLVFSSPAAEI